MSRCDTERQLIRDAKQNLREAKHDAAGAQSEINHIAVELGTTAASELVCMVRAGLAGGASAGPLGVGLGMGFCIGVGTWGVWKLAQRNEEAQARLHQAQAAQTRAQRDLSAAMDAYFKCMDDLPDAGCGSRGGPGWRRPSGKCASWDDYVQSPVLYV